MIKEVDNNVLVEIKDNVSITKMTVNSSPYAVEAYERLGFVNSILKYI